MTLTAPDLTGDEATEGGRRRRKLGAVVIFGALGVAIALSLMLGSRTFGVAETLSAFWRDNGDAHVIVMEQRLPRTVLGVLVGLALGASGALMQGLTRNPLADPGLFGVSAGATLGITLLALLASAPSMFQLTMAAFAGGVIATVGVWMIGTAGGRSGTTLTLVLAGVAASACIAGVVSVVQGLVPRLFVEIRAWGSGDLQGATWDLVDSVMVFVVIGIVLAVFAGRGLNAEALGDDLATALGSNRAVNRVVVVVAVTLLCGVGTAAIGPVVFIGMMVPHLARWFSGVDQRWILAYSLGIGAVLLLVADVIGRVIASPSEIPAGIVAAFVGGPALVFLVRRRRVTSL